MGKDKAKVRGRKRMAASLSVASPPPLSEVMTTKQSAGKAAVVKQKGGGARLWMRMDRWGQSELIECDKSVIIERVSIPARDMRIHGPVFSHSSSILGRDKAIVVNLEFIRVIITAEEVLLLDPLLQEVLQFVDQLRQLLLDKSSAKSVGSEDSKPKSPRTRQWEPVAEAAEALQAELPFEFQVLEIALGVVCTYLDRGVAELERDAYPLLNELAEHISKKNLDHVRSLKSDLTRLLARVQKVRDEIEKLLDDNEDMAQLYLTRKWKMNQQFEALAGAMASNDVNPTANYFHRLGSTRSSAGANYYLSDDIEDLEMLLEAYFTQLEGTRNKILSVREYIDDTEDYVNIQLDHRRNDFLELKMTLLIAGFAIALETLTSGWFGMNIPCTLYEMDVFWLCVGVMTAFSIAVFFLILGYARWKKLLGT